MWKRICMVVLPCLISPFAFADCEPEENINPEFVKSFKLAEKGNVIEQRNVAASYEVGYLVGPCFKNAYYWYDKAAKNKDEISIQWVARQDSLKTMADGKECFGAGCHAVSEQGVIAASAYAGPHGHFFAPLTINGKTVDGMIDSGASVISLNEKAAKEFDLDFTGAKNAVAMTANGVVSMREMILPTLFVSGLRVDDVRVSCCSTGPILIGMSFLNRVKVSMGGGVMSFQK